MFPTLQNISYPDRDLFSHVWFIWVSFCSWTWAAEESSPWTPACFGKVWEVNDISLSCGIRKLQPPVLWITTLHVLCWALECCRFINSACTGFQCTWAKDIFIWGLASLQTALLQGVRFIGLEAPLLVFRTHFQVHMTCQLLTYLPILLHIFLLKLNMKWQKCRNTCVLHSVNITAKKTTLTCQLTTEKISLISVEALWFLISTTCNKEENWKYRIMNFTIKYIYKKAWRNLFACPQSEFQPLLLFVCVHLPTIFYREIPEI